MKNEKLLLKFVAIFWCITGYTQKPRQAAKPASINISGKLDQGTDSAVIIARYFKHYFAARGQRDAVSYEAEVSNNVFHIEIPDILKTGYISLEQRSAGNRRAIVSLYLCEPGDNINISIQKDTITFSGRGSEKWTCQYLVNKIDKFPIHFFSQQKEIVEKRGKKFFWELANLKTDSLYNRKLQVLLHWRKAIGLGIYSQLEADIIGEKLYERYRSYSISARNNDKQLLDDHFKSLMVKDSIHLPCSEGISRSKYYLGALVLKMRVNLMIKSGRPESTSHLYEEMFRLLSSYPTCLREGVFANFIVDLVTRIGYDENNYLEKVKPYIKDEYLKEIIEDNKLKFNKKPAYSFALPDENGNLVKLTDFKDKIVVMNFRTATCSYCNNLEKWLHIIRKEFKGDSDIVFIAVSVDFEKAAWEKKLKSIKGDGINVFTEGKGIEHPLIKFYDYVGVPQLLIINKGIVEDAYPKRPINEATTKEFIQLLYKIKFNSIP